MPTKRPVPDLILDGVIRALEGAVNDLKGLVDPDYRTPDLKPVKTHKVPPGRGPSDIAEGIEIFNTMHATKFSRMPYLSVADKMALGRLHKELPDFRDIVAAYLDSGDPWIVKQGYAPRFIPSQVEALRKASLPTPEPIIRPKEWK